MGFGFRKRINIAPGVRLNISKSGISTSIGGKGLTVNSRGRVTASVPGTGLSYRSNLNGSSQRRYSGARFNAEGGGAIEGMSKREIANENFATQLSYRVSKASQDYFFSHGILVSSQDLDQAWNLEPHVKLTPLFATEMEEMARTTQLLRDIGTVSLPTKEKTMRAVYAFEETLENHRGDFNNFRFLLLEMQAAYAAVPAQPRWILAAILWVLAGICFAAHSLTMGLIFLICGGAALFLYITRAKKRSEAIAKAQLTMDAIENAAQAVVTPAHEFLAS